MKSSIKVDESDECGSSAALFNERCICLNSKPHVARSQDLHRVIYSKQPLTEAVMQIGFNIPKQHHFVFLQTCCERLMQEHFMDFMDMSSFFCCSMAWS